MSGAREGSETGRKRPRIVLTGQEARQGEIILRNPIRRAVFIGGLVAVVLVALALGVLLG